VQASQTNEELARVHSISWKWFSPYP